MDRWNGLCKPLKACHLLNSYQPASIRRQHSFSTWKFQAESFSHKTSSAKALKALIRKSWERFMCEVNSRGRKTFFFEFLNKQLFTGALNRKASCQVRMIFEDFWRNRFWPIMCKENQRKKLKVPFTCASVSWRFIKLCLLASEPSSSFSPMLECSKITNMIA